MPSGWSSNGDKASSRPIAAEGWLVRRQTSRMVNSMHKWSERYFVLNGTTLSQYLKSEDFYLRKEAKTQHELEQGCCVSEISEVTMPKNLKRRMSPQSEPLYTFTILFPGMALKAIAGGATNDETPSSASGYGSEGESSGEDDTQAPQDDSGGTGNRSFTGDAQSASMPPDAHHAADAASPTSSAGYSSHSPASFQGSKGSQGGAGSGTPGPGAVKDACASSMQSPGDKAPDEGQQALTLTQLGRRAMMQSHFVKVRAVATRELEDDKGKHDPFTRKAQIMVAGIAVGGVALSVFTLGIATVPYVFVVGSVVAGSAVGGGTVGFYTRPGEGGRLVLAARSYEDALRWKLTIESEVAKCEGRRPQPPPDLKVDLLNYWISAASNTWCLETVLHGMRVLKESRDDRVDAAAASAIARKLQIAVRATPLDVFLTAMSSFSCEPLDHFSPQDDEPTPGSGGSSSAPVQTEADATQSSATNAPGAMKLARSDSDKPEDSPDTTTLRHVAITLSRVMEDVELVDRTDHHVDSVSFVVKPLRKLRAAEVTASSSCQSIARASSHWPKASLVVQALACLLEQSSKTHTQYRLFQMRRFWRLDEDGSFVICMNSLSETNRMGGGGGSGVDGTSELVTGAMDATMIISPRSDYAHYSADLEESRVTFFSRVDPGGYFNAKKASFFFSGLRFSLLKPWTWIYLWQEAVALVAVRLQTELHHSVLTTMIDIKETAEHCDVLMPNLLSKHGHALATALDWPDGVEDDEPLSKELAELQSEISRQEATVKRLEARMKEASVPRPNPSDPMSDTNARNSVRMQLVELQDAISELNERKKRYSQLLSEERNKRTDDTTAQSGYKSRWKRTLQRYRRTRSAERKRRRATRSLSPQPAPTRMSVKSKVAMKVRKYRRRGRREDLGFPETTESTSGLQNKAIWHQIPPSHWLEEDNCGHAAVPVQGDQWSWGVAAATLLVLVFVALAATAYLGSMLGTGTLLMAVQ